MSARAARRPPVVRGGSGNPSGRLHYLPESRPLGRSWTGSIATTAPSSSAITQLVLATARAVPPPRGHADGQRPGSGRRGARARRTACVTLGLSKSGFAPPRSSSLRSRRHLVETGALGVCVRPVGVREGDGRCPDDRQHRLVLARPVRARRSSLPGKGASARYHGAGPGLASGFTAPSCRAKAAGSVVGSSQTWRSHT